MTKKILLVGWSKSPNIGTNLQSLSLYFALNKIGECRLLLERNYYPSKSKTFIQNVKHIIKLIVPASILYSYGNADEVSKAYRQIRTICINSKSGLKKVIRDYDCFVVGSDQVWNPYYLNTTYLLDFIPDSCRKIAYSSSIGVSEIPQEYWPVYTKYLSNFSYLSMREKVGAEVMEKIIHRPIDVVADPTFLTLPEEWSHFCADAKIKEKYPDSFLLCYFVGNNPEKNYRAADALSNKYNLPVVLISIDSSCDKTYITDDKHFILKHVGPKEFVYLVSKSQAICTDSFHMLSFALQYKKQVHVVKRFSDKDGIRSQNSRIDNLGELVGLNFWDNSTDFIRTDSAAVQKKISDFRDSSFNKLKDAIVGESK